MSSQQKQTIDQNQRNHQKQNHQIKKRKAIHNKYKNRIIFSQSQNFEEISNEIQLNVKSKFDIKKFQHTVLKQILVKNHNSGDKNKVFNNESNKRQNQKSLSHLKSFKLISNQRKISRSKSKQCKNQLTKKLNKQKQMIKKSHLSNTKILRQKLLSSLSLFDDYEMINIESSINLLKQAKILKVLTSLEQTKCKIQSRNLPEGRIKQQAKFIYFLWKMINEEFITTRHLKEIILLLNQLNQNDLIDTLNELYTREVQIVKMFVDCWMKLKLDKFYYQINTSKDKIIHKRQLSINQIQHKYKTIGQKALKQNQKTFKKVERIKTQGNQYKVNQNQWQNQNQEQFRQIKFLQPKQEKKLIERLYEQKKDFINKRQRVRTQNDQQKQSQKLKECTFKPLLTSQVNSRSSSKSNLILKTTNCLNNAKKIKQTSNQNSLDTTKQRSLSKVNGFQKAIKRMKSGHSQTKLKLQLLSYYSTGQNYEKIKKQPMNPPKFLSRQKEKKQDLILFVIQFEIGRHKVKVKIHPTDTQMSVSKKIAKIYGLKSQEQQEIKQIVSMQLNNYYKKIGDEVSQFIQA